MFFISYKKGKKTLSVHLFNIVLCYFNGNEIYRAIFKMSKQI